MCCRTGRVAALVWQRLLSPLFLVLGRCRGEIFPVGPVSMKSRMKVSAFISSNKVKIEAKLIVSEVYPVSSSSTHVYYLYLLSLLDNFPLSTRQTAAESFENLAYGYIKSEVGSGVSRSFGDSFFGRSRKSNCTYTPGNARGLLCRLLRLRTCP